MSLFPDAPLASVGAFVRSTLDERVTLLRPGTPGVDAYRQPTAGAPVEVGPVAASVRPQPVDERLRADQITARTRYTVRIARENVPTDIDASWSLRWERAAERGGPLALALMADPIDDHGRGRFVDLICEG